MEDIVVFLIFLFTDLFIAGIFIFVYSGKERYANGMILGVHVPQEAESDSEAAALISSYKNNFRRFHLLNLFAGAALCLLCFYKITLFLILWCIWLFAYLFAGMGIVYSAHYKLYQIKLKRQWIRPDQTHVIHVDTAVAALTDKLPLSHWYHLVLVGAMCLLLFFPLRYGNDFNELTFWVFPAAFFLLFLTLWGLHLFICHRRNTVYSADSALNLSLNRMEKRTWSVLLITSDFFNLLATAYVLLKLYFLQWLGTADYLIYCALLLIPSVLLVAGVLHLQKKKQALLSMDGEPLTVDDDEYWKYGWYNNPNDSSLLVADRFSSTSYALNMAKPSAKIFLIVVAAICAATLLGCALLSMQFEHVDIGYSLSSNEVAIDASWYHSEIPLSDITDVKLIEQLPDEDFIRTNGASTEKYLIGHFRGKETGRCMMYLCRDASPILEIDTADLTIYVNSEDEAAVSEWYQALLTASQQKQ